MSRVTLPTSCCYCVCGTCRSINNIPNDIVAQQLNAKSQARALLDSADCELLCNWASMAIGDMKTCHVNDKARALHTCMRRDMYPCSKSNRHSAHVFCTQCTLVLHRINRTPPHVMMVLDLVQACPDTLSKNTIATVVNMRTCSTLST